MLEYLSPTDGIFLFLCLDVLTACNRDIIIVTATGNRTGWATVSFTKTHITGCTVHINTPYWLTVITISIKYVLAVLSNVITYDDM